MKLHDLLAKVGNKYVIQMLQTCIKGAKEKKRPHKHTEVTFLTEVVWVEKQAYLDAVNSENEDA